MEFPIVKIPDRAVLGPILAQRANWIVGYSNHPEFQSPVDKLWYFLRKRRLNGFRFRRDKVLAGAFKADFYNYETRLIILVHSDRDVISNAPTSPQGHLILPISHQQIMSEMAAVLEKILKVSCQRAGIVAQ